MVDTLVEVLAQETIAEPEDLASYGLDDPQCTVTLTADGTDYELLIGDETVLGGQLYLSTGDGSVYLVDTPCWTLCLRPVRHHPDGGDPRHGGRVRPDH